jgi:carbohydrate-selective porin OprB
VEALCASDFTVVPSDPDSFLSSLSASDAPEGSTGWSLVSASLVSTYIKYNFKNKLVNHIVFET